jgi:DedD protein
MVTRSDAPDFAVDELKRRARRRLVGAIVLALAAAVLLPLLLESEPKPLGDEVSIQIPPIESGKFVNPLSPGKASDPKAAANRAGAKSATPAEPPSPPAPTPQAAPATEAVVEPAASATASAKGGDVPPPEPAAAPAAAPVAPLADQSVPPPTASKAPAPSAQAGAGQTSPAFAVQVAAFTDRYGALAVVRKLKQAGFTAYVEPPAAGDKSALYRVRVGPYASREAADATRAKLKTAGYDAIVARVR